MLSSKEATEQTFSVLTNYGHTNYLGEPLSKLDHGIQCAQQAEVAAQPVHVILGALLHDIGHQLGERDGLPKMMSNGVDYGTVQHELVGEQFLKSLGFPSAVTNFVKHHVSAKRYLVTRRPGYYDKLSPASKTTLTHQGGPMTDEEADQFEQYADFEACLAMRVWDEGGKNSESCSNDDVIRRYKHLCCDYLEGVLKSAN